MLIFVWAMPSEATTMDAQPLDRAVAAVMRQDGVSKQQATGQVLDFLGKVDGWMVAGINPLELFVERFRLSEDYLLEILYGHMAD
jgi:hypothetical protein